MKKTEADRLRDIANELDDQYHYSNRDGYNKQSQWFRWAAEEIRKVIMDGGFNSINEKYSKTSTTTQEE